MSSAGALGGLFSPSVTEVTGSSLLLLLQADKTHKKSTLSGAFRRVGRISIAYLLAVVVVRPYDSSLGLYTFWCDGFGNITKELYLSLNYANTSLARFHRV